MSRFGAALAVAFAIRRERRNLLWRFSHLKAGAWLMLLQIGLAGAAVYHSFRSDFALPFASAFALVVAQGALWGALSEFGRARERLYRSRLCELVHLSPAPPHSLPVGSFLADLPAQAWTSLVWAVLFSSPWAGRWWSLPILWIACLAATTGAQLATSRLVVAAVRLWPGVLAWMWGLSVAGTLAVLSLVAYALLHPEWLESATRTLVRVAPPIAATLAVAGAAAGVRAARQPERFGALYQESWQRFVERSRAVERRHASRWPALAIGAAGAIQAKDWLLIARNPLSWIRLGIFAAILVVPALLRPWLSALPPDTRRLAAGAAPFAVALFVLGEVAAALVVAERERLALYALSGGSAARVLAGKALAALPVVLLTAGLYGFSGWLFALDVPVAGLLAQGFFTGIGMVAVLLGASALEAPRQLHGVQADEAYKQLFEQIPTGVYTQAGFLVAALFGAALVWGTPLLERLAWVVPAAVLVAGWLRLERFLRRGQRR